MEILFYRKLLSRQRFSLELGLKDATLIKKQAETAGAKMPLGNLVQQEYQQLFNNGYGDYDWSALALSIK